MKWKLAWKKISAVSLYTSLLWSSATTLMIPTLIGAASLFQVDYPGIFIWEGGNDQI